MKILFVDPLNNGNSHIAFNRTIIGAALSQKHNTGILVARRDHILACEINTNQISDSKVVAVSPLPCRTEGSNILLLLQLLRAFFDALKQVRRHKPEILLLLSADNFVTPNAIRAMRACLRGSSPRTLVFLHNNFYRILTSPAVRERWRKTLCTPGVEVLALTHGQMSLLRNHFPGTISHLVYPPTYAHLKDFTYHTVTTDQSCCPDFLFLGHHARLLGSSPAGGIFVKACDQAAVVIGRKITITTVGLSEFNASAPNVDLCLVTNRISYQEYMTIIHRSKFMVFLRDVDSDYRASGVLTDALTAGTPFLAPRAGPYEELGLLGPIGGFLFDDESSWPQIVQDALTLSEKQYRAMRLYNTRLSEQFSFDATAETLQAIFEQNQVNEI